MVRIEPYSQQIGIEIVIILPKPNQSSYGSVQIGLSTDMPSERQIQQLFINSDSCQTEVKSLIIYMIPLQRHAISLRSCDYTDDPNPYVKILILKVSSSSITEEISSIVLAPCPGNPSVKNSITFSELAQGTPNQSSSADFSIQNPSLNATQQLVPPQTVNSSTAYINYYLWEMVALVILDESNLLASDEKVTIPIKSLLLRVLITFLAASFAIPILLLLYIDSEISIINITFLPPDVADTYHGRYLGSQSRHSKFFVYIDAGYCRIEPKGVPIYANPQRPQRPLSRS